MNKFLNNLERKIGKWAIPNLTMLMIGCYVIGYILQMISPQVFSYMTLEPAYILRGQLWRIVTWIRTFIQGIVGHANGTAQPVDMGV